MNTDKWKKPFRMESGVGDESITMNSLFLVEIGIQRINTNYRYCRKTEIKIMSFFSCALYVVNTR